MTDQIQTRQPAGLWLIAAAQACERGAYYLMRAVLIMYLIGALKTQDAQAVKIYGFFTSINMFGGAALGVLGGFLGDLLGHKRVALISGVLIAAGLFIMGGGTLPALGIGLGLLVVGGGIFRVAVTTLAGLLYHKNDIRRDGGFTYLSLAFNIGAFAGSLFSETGASAPFFIAGAIMLAGAGLLAFLQNSAAAPAPREGGREQGFNGAAFGAVAVLAVAIILLWGFTGDSGNRVIGIFVKNTVSLPYMMMGVYTLFVTLFTLIFPHIYIRRKSGSFGKIVWGFIFAAGAMLIMLPAAALGGAGKAAIIAAYAALAAGEVLIMPVLSSVITNAAPRERAGFFIGLALCIMRFAGAIASSLVFYAAFEAATPAAFAGLLAAALLGAGITFGLVKALKPRLS